MTGEKVRTTHLEQMKDYQFQVTFDEPFNGSLLLDEPAPLGKGEGPNASQILAAAVGNCLSASLLFCLKKVRVDPGKIKTTVKTTFARNEKGLLRIARMDVIISPETGDPEQAGYARCLKLFEDYCVVTQSVRQGIEVNVEVQPRAL